MITSAWAGCQKLIPGNVEVAYAVAGAWHAVFAGPETFVATIRMQRAITELAYLRDALTRGIIDDTGRVREKELLAKIRSIRGKAIIQPEGRAAYPSLRRRRTSAIAAYPPPSYPGPAGLGGNYPAQARSRRRQAYLSAPAAASVPWGIVLPNTLRSTPPGNRPENRESRMAGRQLTPLESALTELRARWRRCASAYHCPVPRSSAKADEIKRQLDDYVMPRLATIDAPLLAVVEAQPSGQVDAGELAGRSGGQRSRGDPPDHPCPGAGASQ